MTTLLDAIDATTPDETTTPARRLRHEMIASRVRFTWLGTDRSLTPGQRRQAATAFDADSQSLRAGKRLLNTAHPAYRAVTAVRGKVETYWRGTSLPWTERGIRLIRQDQVEAFAGQLADYRAELLDAARHLDGHYAELRAEARRTLGRLFSEADYPDSLAGAFDLDWDFPSVEAPEHLLAHPEVYRREQERVRARFEEAVELAERAFTEEFARLVEHLAERIGGVGADGQPKVFRDSAVDNLSEFLHRFRSLNVRSNAQLDELVERAQHAVRGVGAQDLRDGQALRQRVAAQLSQVRTALDGLMVDRPRRRILRQAATPGGA